MSPPPLDLASAALQPVADVLVGLDTTEGGLTADEAARRFQSLGPNVLASHRVTALGVLVRQLRNPLLILLLAAAGVSALTGSITDGAIIAAIVVLSVGLGFVNEYPSEVAVAALHANIRHTAVVWRDGTQDRVDCRDLVPGDVLALAVGDLVPAAVRAVAAAARATRIRIVRVPTMMLLRPKRRGLPRRFNEANAPRVELQRVGPPTADSEAAGGSLGSFGSETPASGAQAAVEPEIGFEPMTCSLRVSCSTS